MVKEEKTLLAQYLSSLGACTSAVEWANTYKTATAMDVYNRCKKGEWLIWFAGTLGLPREELIGLVQYCFNEIVKSVTDDSKVDALTYGNIWLHGGKVDVQYGKDVYGAAYQEAGEFRSGVYCPTYRNNTDLAAFLAYCTDYPFTADITKWREITATQSNVAANIIRTHLPWEKISPFVKYTGE